METFIIVPRSSVDIRTIVEELVGECFIREDALFPCEINLPESFIVSEERVTTLDVISVAPLPSDDVPFNEE